MTKDEALRLSLEALEDAADAIDSWGSYASGYHQVKHGYENDIQAAHEAIIAIKEALSGCQCPECRIKPHSSDCAVHNEPAYPKGDCNCGAQPSVSVEQEPVAWMKVGGMKAMPALEKEAWLSTGREFDRQCVEDYTIPLYTTPPQRKPLTPEWYAQWIRDNYQDHPTISGLCDAIIEAAHGIKE